MPYKKFVEIGRVVFCAEGKEEGKLGIIINVIDQNRILISGPCTDLPRQEYRIKQIHLTNWVLETAVGAEDAELKEQYEAEKIQEKWGTGRMAEARHED